MDAGHGLAAGKTQCDDAQRMPCKVPAPAAAPRCRSAAGYRWAELAAGQAELGEKVQISALRTMKASACRHRTALPADLLGAKHTAEPVSRTRRWIWARGPAASLK